jgi:hypothetical protein
MIRAKFDNQHLEEFYISAEESEIDRVCNSMSIVDLIIS